MLRLLSHPYTATESADAPSTVGGSGSWAKPDGVIRIIQLTDLHLYASPTGRLLGQDTRQTLDSVLDLARRRHWPPDALVLTGDLVHDESLDGYLHLKQRLDALQVPHYCIPGNHDRIELLAAALDFKAIASARAVHFQHWDLVLLDSTELYEESGNFTEHLLSRLEPLICDVDRYVLIALHHQPIAVGSGWMDTMMTANADKFFRLLDRCQGVRGIIWGHVHQFFDAERKGVRLLASPSTCIQFLPHSEDFAVDRLTPGYRWLELHPDGHIETGVERTDAYPDPLDLGSSGY